MCMPRLHSHKQRKSHRSTSCCPRVRCPRAAGWTGRFAIRAGPSNGGQDLGLALQSLLCPEPFADLGVDALQPALDLLQPLLVELLGHGGAQVLAAVGQSMMFSGRVKTLVSNSPLKGATPGSGLEALGAPTGHGNA